MQLWLSLKQRLIGYEILIEVWEKGLFTMKEDKKQKDDQIDIPKITSDFQCSVCGAIFTTDEDRKQHLEKEAHGQLRDDETTEEEEIAKKQEELDESHPHRI
ncbi:MAG: hypothetical protein JO327_06725 [Nitrososphaeraceae archaeon]|nr:hypothetical protein [Nitrososphaeraceae archaeon]MBV9667809.1 hypothetical protein [Nitrososphaeraceae archaeon]